MPRNASGTYTLPAGNPVSAGTLVEAAWANTTLNDLGAEMTDSLSRSGEGGMLVSFKIADGTVALPGLAFTLEPGTGLSRLGTNEFDFSVGGSRVIQLTVNGMTVTAGLAVLVDTINESTVDAGVTVEGIKLKDSKIEFSDTVTIDSPVAGELAINADDVQIISTDITQLEVISTESGTGTAPYLMLTRDSASAANNDYLGALSFFGNNDASERTHYIKVGGRILDVADGSEDAQLTITVMRAGALTTAVLISRSDTTVYGLFRVTGATADASTYNIIFRNSDSTNLFYIRNDGIFNSGLASGSPYNLTTAVAANMYVNSSGNVYRSTSSARFKTNVEPIEDTWADKILDMQPIYYKSIATGDVGVMPENWTHYGFSAEQVATVDPRLVSFKTHEYHMGGADDTEEISTELDEPIADGVQYVKMIPALVNLIKRQRDEISALTARVLALENA